MLHGQTHLSIRCNRKRDCFTSIRCNFHGNFYMEQNKRNVKHAWKREEEEHETNEFNKNNGQYSLQLFGMYYVLLTLI